MIYSLKLIHKDEIPAFEEAETMEDVIDLIDSKDVCCYSKCYTDDDIEIRIYYSDVKHSKFMAPIFEDLFGIELGEDSVIIIYGN